MAHGPKHRFSIGFVHGLGVISAWLNYVEAKFWWLNHVKSRYPLKIPMFHCKIRMLFLKSPYNISIYIHTVHIYMYSIVRPPSKNSGWDGDGQSSKARARQDGVDWTLESKAKWRRWCRALQQWSSPQWIKLVGGLEHEWIIFHFIYGRIFHIVNSRSTIYISGWWFQRSFIFHNIWDNPSHWRTHIFG